MDEVHYLADRFRGAVWEEVIIHLPGVGDRRGAVGHGQQRRGVRRLARDRARRDAIIVEEHRPVPLWQHVHGRAAHVRPVRRRRAARSSIPSWCGWRARRSGATPRPGEQRRGRDRGRPRGPKTPWRSEVVERLEREGLLPAIYFLFSRAGCDEAVRQCLHAGLRLTTRRGAHGDPAGGARGHAGAARRGPRRARLRRVARGPRARPRRPPRRPAAGVQGDRRGAVPARPHQGRVRHRDPRPRHQHAGASPSCSSGW